MKQHMMMNLQAGTVQGSGRHSLIKGALHLLGLLMIFSVAPAQADTQNKITALSVSEPAAGTTVLKVDLESPLGTLPAGFTVNAPARIALDFPNTANGLGKSTQEFAAGDLRSANIVQAGARTRLVINLDHMMTYETRMEGNSVLITMHPQAAEQTDTVSRFAEAAAGVQKHALTGVDFHRGKNGEGRIQVDLSDSGVGIDIHRQGTKLIVDFLKANLPKNLQRKLDVVDFATPVQSVDTFTQGGNVRMVIDPKGNWEHAAYQTDKKFIVEVKPVVEDPSKLTKGPGYTGEKLTLNFQDISVREALNVIADFTNKNMVISDSVTGNLTLRLKDVPWDQALDIILQSRGLSMRANGNVIQVAPTAEMAASEKNDLTARQEVSELEELHTESFQLGYQTASSVALLLNGVSVAAPGAPAATPMPGTGAQQSTPLRILSKRGSAIADGRTNTLFVNDTPSRLDDVRKLIKQIDVPAKQVLIEARVVQAHDGFAQNLGVRLGYQGAQPGPTGGNSPRLQLTGAGGTGGVGMGTVFTPSTTNVNLPVDQVGNPNAGVFQFALFNAAASKILNIELNAMQSDEIGKIISSPRVVSENNDSEWAVVEQGQELPYIISTVAGGTVVNTVSFKDAVLKLGVKTKITPDNNIDMTVEVKKDSAGVAISGAIPINTNKVITKVLVENGGTVVIGGVYTQNDDNTVNKVPLLGDIPFLGALFRSKAVSSVKDELLVFLSPKIMQDALNLR
jgi:type IV pilus assembly protein PilQ